VRLVSFLPRTQECDGACARTRLQHARSFLAVAELVGTEHDEIASASVATALAVLAGIAAADAICCAELRMRSRGQDHRQAGELLRTIVPDGHSMARDLGRLLAIKDDAHYGLLDVGAQRAALALRQARNLVAAAEKHVRARV
jgi:hypothetical protein